MKIVIVGCGRVGAVLAESYDAAGHEVVVLDMSTRAFDRLPSEFRGSAIRGDGTDEDTLRRAGSEGADIFLALTEGDNRNTMAAQVATEKLGIERVVAKINDPVRAAAYAELGITTVCRTTMLADAISGLLGFAPSGVPSVIAASGGHHADQDRPPIASRVAITTAEASGTTASGTTASDTTASGTTASGAGAGREG